MINHINIPIKSIGSAKQPRRPITGEIILITIDFIVAAAVRRASPRGVVHALTFLSSQSKDQRKPTFRHIILRE